MERAKAGAAEIEPKTCHLMIQNACVITMDAERRVFPSGSIAISDRDIVGAGPTREIATRFRGRRTIDAEGGIVHPGYIDTHVHASLMNARGAFPDTLSWEKSNEFYSAWWNEIGTEDEYASGLHAFVEMVRNGTTCVMDSGTALEPDVLAQAMEASGIRGLVTDLWLWDVEGYPGADAMKRRPVSRKRSLASLGGQLFRNKDGAARVRGYVGLFGIGACSDELMLAAKEVADKGRVTLSQHQSFGATDTGADDARFGRHPLVHFAEIGTLGPNCLFTHMNVIRDDEMTCIVESGMAITWCLTSSMIWGNGGTFRGRQDEMHRSGVTVALGCDAGNSALRYDLSQQGVLTVLTTREKRMKRDALTPEDALEMLTIAGAKGVGLGDLIGSIEPGKRADLVIRSPHVPEMQPGLDEIQTLVLSLGSKSVDTVVIDGTIVVRKGRHTLLDEEVVYRKLREFARRIAGKIGLAAAPAWPRVH